jgi:hypothetical protein
MKHSVPILAGLCGFALLSGFAAAASPKAPQIKLRKESNMQEVLADLTPEGIKLEAEYTFEAPKAGKYALTSRMASSRWDMSLLVSANGAEPVEMEIPFKTGLWETSAPVVVELKAGSNTLAFARPEDMRKGIAIKDFTLTPLN